MGQNGHDNDIQGICEGLLNNAIRIKNFRDLMMTNVVHFTGGFAWLIPLLIRRNWQREMEANILANNVDLVLLFLFVHRLYKAIWINNSFNHFFLDEGGGWGVVYTFGVSNTQNAYNKRNIGQRTPQGYGVALALNIF